MTADSHAPPWQLAAMSPQAASVEHLTATAALGALLGLPTATAVEQLRRTWLERIGAMITEIGLAWVAATPTVGESIYRYRRSLGKSRREFAAECGISVYGLARIERWRLRRGD